MSKVPPSPFSLGLFNHLVLTMRKGRDSKNLKELVFDLTDDKNHRVDHCTGSGGWDSSDSGHTTRQIGTNDVIKKDKWYRQYVSLRFSVG